MNSTPMEAAWLSMSMGSWTEQELRDAFDSGLSPEEHVRRAIELDVETVGMDMWKALAIIREGMPEDVRKDLADPADYV